MQKQPYSTGVERHGMALHSILPTSSPVQSSPVLQLRPLGSRPMQVGTSFIVQKVPADTPLAASTEVIAALRCTALRCTALHCTALHCNCDRSYSVPAASLSLRCGVTAQAVTRRAMRGCHSTTVCQQCTGRVCASCRAVPRGTLLSAHRNVCCIFRAACCTVCVVPWKLRIGVPQAVCRFALCTVDSRYFVWLPGRFARGNAARRSRWHCRVLAAVCGGT
jgi:hypothetical protein